MPAGNVTYLDRFKRLQAIRDLKEEGKSDQEIADEIGMSLVAVKRNVKYLDDLAVSDLTSKEIAAKRQELFLELSEATNEAKALFEKYRDNTSSSSTDIKRWFMAWLESIEAKAKLYGLDNLKVDNLIQVNTQNNYEVVKDSLPAGVKEKIARTLITEHEAKLREKYNGEV